MNVLDISLASFNVSQDDLGWIGFSLALGGTVGGIVSGRVCDMFPGRMALVIACLYGAATVLIALFIMTLEVRVARHTVVAWHASFMIVVSFIGHP